MYFISISCREFLFPTNQIPRRYFPVYRGNRVLRVKSKCVFHGRRAGR